jgi:hypothetical protein
MSGGGTVQSDAGATTGSGGVPGAGGGAGGGPVGPGGPGTGGVYGQDGGGKSPGQVTGGCACDLGASQGSGRWPPASSVTLLLAGLGVFVARPRKGSRGGAKRSARR